jgi:hypothetical protein
MQTTCAMHVRPRIKARQGHTHMQKARKESQNIQNRKLETESSMVAPLYIY